jgi:hypothetical protein
MGLVTLGWLSLMLFPRQSWANFWFAGVAIPLVLSLIHMYSVIAYWSQHPEGKFIQFGSLTGVYAMFANQGLLLAGWIDLIAMALVAGAWMTRKAAQIRSPYIYLLPCLILTFAFAGFGFTLFAIITAIGAGWTEVAKFEEQPPVNTAAAIGRPSGD